MKRRKGYRSTDPTGTNWYGDCPRWAAAERALGNKVEPAAIYGTGRSYCGACADRTRH